MLGAEMSHNELPRWAQKQREKIWDVRERVTAGEVGLAMVLCERRDGVESEGNEERERDVKGWVEAEGRAGSMSKSRLRETEM